MFTLIMGWILLFAMPPIGFIILMYYFFWKEPRDERRKDERERLRYTNANNIYTSTPADCPMCGEINWLRGPTKMVPSGGFRLFHWPTNGTAMVAYFTCASCGTRGRYGMCVEAAEHGWILLDRYAGGW